MDKHGIGIGVNDAKGDGILNHLGLVGTYDKEIRVRFCSFRHVFDTDGSSRGRFTGTLIMKFTEMNEN
jgi:hypothetical protein